MTHPRALSRPVTECGGHRGIPSAKSKQSESLLDVRSLSKTPSAQTAAASTSLPGCLPAHTQKHHRLIKMTISTRTVPLPTSVAWLESATLEVTATQQLKRDVRYVLTVHHKSSRSKWSLGRSYDEYRQFQHRLLQALESGHFCCAECPWLYTFVTSYFPKSCLFRSSSARVIAFRRETLQNYMTTIQSVLLNRDNHCCNVLVSRVVHEFSEFLCGPGGIESLPLKQWAFAQQRSGSRGGSRESLDSQASTSDEEATTTNSSGSFDDALCGVCDCAVDGYKTKLHCGHQFHDECIVQKLNESMQCPTCGHSESLQH